MPEPQPGAACLPQYEAARFNADFRLQAVLAGAFPVKTHGRGGACRGPVWRSHRKRPAEGRRINADGDGACCQSAGNNGADDRPTINVGPICGAITLDCRPAEGAIHNPIRNPSPGLTLQLDNLAQDSAAGSPFKE